MNKLYRGVCVNANEISELALGDKEIRLNYEPIINENGEKVVKDGNEYGVYMSDNKNMVEDVYGNVHSLGEAISSVRYKSGGLSMPVTKPKVSVIYEINPENLPNLRKPKITSALEGHYNNGYGGDEWICDYIPKENYCTTKVCVGYDSLFESKSFDMQGKSRDEIVKLIDAEMNMREIRLKEFASILETMPEIKRNNVKLDMFKYLLGRENVAHLDAENFKPETEEDKIKFLMATEYQNNGYNPTIDYLFDLKKRVAMSKTDFNLNEILTALATEIDFRLEKNEFPNEKVKATLKVKKSMIDSFLMKLKSIEEPKMSESGLGE